MVEGCAGRVMSTAWRYVTEHSGSRPRTWRTRRAELWLPKSGQGWGTGRCNGFSPDGIGSPLNYTVSARAAGPDGVTYVDPLTMSFQATRAVLLANATAANFGDLRFRRSANQGDALPWRSACRITAVAPTTSTLRSCSSPARVMPPGLALPAVEWSFGVRPIQAANCRPD